MLLLVPILGGRVWEEEARSLPLCLGQHPPGTKFLGLIPCSPSACPAARLVSSGDDSKIPSSRKPHDHSFSKRVQQLFLVGYRRFLVSAVEASGSIAQHCLEAKSAKK